MTQDEIISVDKIRAPIEHKNMYADFKQNNLPLYFTTVNNYNTLFFLVQLYVESLYSSSVKVIS